jgi:pimeloyl-ACP methyl ester carboxylesterase
MANDVAIVFLHGGKQGSWIWDEVRAAIALQAGVNTPEMLALDVPGCGVKSGRAVGSMALSDVVTDLASDIALFEASRIMLVGHSQAGTVLPRLAAAHRERVARIVYLSCSVPAEGQTLAAMLGTGRQGENDEEIGWPCDRNTTPLEEMFSTMFCNDMDQAARVAFLTRLGDDDWPLACTTTDTNWGCAAVHDIPAHYIVALRDQILTQPWQERFAARFGVTEVSRIDAGHQLMQTRPQAVAEALLMQLKDIA